jgi:hypothetical protein
MEEIIELMKEYAENHRIRNGVTLILDDNYTGLVRNFETEKTIFYYNSIDDLKQKLKE